VLERIARFSRNEFPPGIRNELSYLLGKHLFQTGDLRRAEEILRGVQASSQFYPRAQFVYGLVQIRFGRPDEAQKAFQAVFDLVPSGSAETEMGPLRELAQLNIARILYQLERFKDANRLYRRIDGKSANWIAAIFESAWAVFRERDYAKALGNLLTLDSPFYENEFFPEAYLLRAVTAFRNCRYDEVDRTVDLFLQRFEPLATELKKQIQRLGNSSDKYYEFFVEMRNRAVSKPGAATAGGAGAGVSGEKGDSALLGRVLKLSLADRALTRMHAFVMQLDRELAAIRSTRGVWRKSALARSMFEAVSYHREQAAIDAGKRVRDRFVGAHTEIESLVQQAYRLRFETQNARLNRLTAEAREELEFAPARPARKIALHEVVYPFKGEFWRDELGYYEVDVKPECQKK
jgi:tetratricopeptide (TPR) repeat protein